MRALVYRAPSTLAFEERPRPELAPGEVVLKVRAVGICGSELHGYLGHDSTCSPGMVFGHELAGEVVQSTSPRFPPGTLVTANSAVTCGTCDFCIQGRDNLCVDRRRLGKVRPGAFAEYVAVPVSALIEVPQHMDPVCMALVEPTATALHAINVSARCLARPPTEGRVLVIGAGAIGFIAAAVLAARGCRDLTVGDTNPLRRDTVAKHVDCATYDPVSGPPPEADYEYVIDAVGAQASLSAAMRAVKRGGVIAEVGLSGHECALDIQKLTRAGIALVGSANYPAAELRAAVRAIDGGLFRDFGWVQLRAFADAPAAFDDLAHGRLPHAKVVLTPE